jgi:sortase A
VRTPFAAAIGLVGLAGAVLSLTELARTPGTPVSQPDAVRSAPGAEPAAHSPVRLISGAAFATLTIPRLWGGGSFNVYENATDANLLKGPAHESGTALPGQTGNFAVLGHTLNAGNAFLRLSTIRVGDTITVTDSAGTYTYRVVQSSRVIPATDVDVLDPVPNHPDARATTALMTITSCLYPSVDTERQYIEAALVR